MLVLLGLIGMMGIMVIASCIESKNRLKRIKKKIKENFGKIPEVKDLSYEEIALYWKEFNDRIPENEKLDEVTWNDLELNKLFARLNNTQSFAGEQMLYSEMHHIAKEKEKLEELEAGIAYYSEHSKAREEMQFLLWKLGKEEVSYYLPMYLNTLDMFSIPHKWIYRLLQILLIASVLPGIITGQAMMFGLTLVIFLINVVVYTIKIAEYEVYMESLSEIINISKLAKTIVKDKTGLYKEVPVKVKEAVLLFDSLTTSVTKLQKKKNASMSGDALTMLQVYLWGATLQDFMKYDKAIQYLQGKQKEFLELYEFIARIDMVIAVASFRQSIPFYCIPQFTTEKNLDMEGAYHPLIKDPVCNSLNMKKNCMITGSNASGKSTFIKSVALNVILAQSIHTCMARKLILPDALVVTSMAVRDDVMSGESYYIKEIKYLKRIIDGIMGDRLIICVIDEILRGTNTLERIAASAAVLRYLEDTNCLAMVATHDLELTNILKNQYDFYYFCEQISNKDIVFDYKIHQGISNTKNAINLLEYVGFPEEIIMDAKQSCME